MRTTTAEKQHRKYAARQKKLDNLFLIKTALGRQAITLERALTLTLMCQQSMSLDDQEHLHYLLMSL